MVGAASQRLAHEARAAAEVEGRGEAAVRCNRAQGLGDEGRGAIAEILCEMLVEARRVVVEEPRDIGPRQRGGRLGSPDQREPRHRALRVGGIGDERLTKGPSRGIEVAKLLPRFAKREPGRRPVWRALERLLEQVRRRAQSPSSAAALA